MRPEVRHELLNFLNHKLTRHDQDTVKRILAKDNSVSEEEEREKRIDDVVEEMRALNVSSITIVQDSVTIGMGDPVTPKPEFPRED